MTSTPEGLPNCEPACQPARTALCIDWSVSLVGLVHPSAIQQHETRDRTRPITAWPILSSKRVPVGQVAALLSRLHPTITWSWSWVGHTLQTAV